MGFPVSRPFVQSGNDIQMKSEMTPNAPTQRDRSVTFTFLNEMGAERGKWGGNSGLKRLESCISRIYLFRDQGLL